MINVPNIKQAPIINNGTSQAKPVNVSASVSQTSYTVPNYTTTIYPQTTVPVWEKTVTETTVPKYVHTSWLYINDVHGKMTNMERIYNISKEFDTSASKEITNFYSNVPQGDISKFKVSSGDIILGANYTHNQVANQFMNWSGFIASALGNHELDIVDPANFAKLLENSKYKMLAANVDIDKNSPLNGRIQKSMIVEKDGEKYGLIGIAPSDMYKRVK